MNPMTLAQYKSAISANSKERAKKSKYRAVSTTIDGIRFHSKKEAEFYKVLKARKERGEIERFHRQVLFDLPGGIKHYIDFLVVTRVPAGYEVVEYYEIKGRDLPIGKMKRKQAEEIYGIEIKII